MLCIQGWHLVLFYMKKDHSAFHTIYFYTRKHVELTVFISPDLNTRIMKYSMLSNFTFFNRNKCALNMDLCYIVIYKIPTINCIFDVKVSLLASSMVGRGFEPRSSQTKDYQICICCFSAKHTVFKQKEQSLVASESR